MKLLQASATFLATTLLAVSAEAPPPKVTYLEAATVTAAFQKGGVLFKGDTYQVNTSRREAPGGAEIHAKYADIVYVLQGTATFVTGGKAVGAKTIAPDETVGSEIAGGDSHKLNKGDVIIVPAGTPHWFKEVTNPFLYLVVKAH